MSRHTNGLILEQNRRIVEMMIWRQREGSRKPIKVIEDHDPGDEG